MLLRSFRVSSIQKRIGLIFLAFLCLLIISVALTFVGLDTQQRDARIINLAGRQRMLLQQMNTLALSAESGEGSEQIPALTSAANTFEQTLTALRGGGSILDYTGERFELPPPSDPNLKAELDRLYQAWVEDRSLIDGLARSTDAATTRAAVRQIVDRSPALIEQADRAVRAFEAVSTARITQLRVYQVAFLLAGLALLTTGWVVTIASVVRPLARLEQSARRIGEGDLVSPVPVDGPSEVRVLGGAMETMRAQRQASRVDLQQWAETLESRVQQRTRELEALAAVSREINSHLSIEEVLNSVTEKARSLLGGEVASLCLLDGEGKVLSLHAAAAPAAAIRGNVSPADDPVVGKVLDQHCAHPCGLQSREGFCQILAPMYRISHLAAPLYSKNRVIGALCVGSPAPNAFRPDMITVLTQLSDAAVVAMDNSRLFQQAEFAATLEERQRIASEMHDGLLQTLSFLRLMVTLLEEKLHEGKFEEVQATLHQIGRAEEQAEFEIRQAINSLQDDYPLNDTLQERLNVMVKELSFASPPVRFETGVILPLVLSRQQSEQVLRIAREAVLNAQRYSKAEAVSIGLEKEDSALILSVKDDGIGFSPGANPEDGRAHFGLKIMQARAARLGGRLDVHSSPGAGTVVELRWNPAAFPKM